MFWILHELVHKNRVPCIVIVSEQIIASWASATLHLCGVWSLGPVSTPSAFDLQQKDFIVGCHRASTLSRWQARDTFRYRLPLKRAAAAVLPCG